MTKTAKIIIGIIIIAGIAWLGCSQYRKSPSESEPVSTEPIKIGVILPLTGPYAAIGEEVQKGINLAAEEARKQGLKFDLLYEDDQGNFGIGTVSAANKLITVNKIDVAITFAVEEAKPIVPIFTAAKIPLVVAFDSNKYISDAGEYIFSNGFSTEKMGEKMAEFAYNKLSLRNVALISHIDALAEIMSKSFKDKFIELGGSIVYEDKYNVGTTDYRTAIAKIKQAKPDGVYFPFIPPSNAQFIMQSKQFGIRVPMMTGDGLMKDVIQEAKESSENIYFTSILDDNNDLALASAGYDSFKKIVQAAVTNSEDIQKGLLEVMGTERTANREEKLYQVKNGVPVEVK